MTEKCPADTSGFVTFGLVLNSDHAFSLLDKGPAADDQKVKRHTLIKYLMRHIFRRNI